MKYAVITSLFVCFLMSCGELSGPRLPVGEPELEVVEGTPGAPLLSGLPDRYGYETLPVRGTSTAFETIFVEGGRAPVASEADVSGSFCLDVPLAQNQPHMLEVYVQNTQGETSEPALIQVQHDAALAEYVTPEQPLVDLCGGLPVYSNESAKEGLFSHLTDADPTTNVLVKKSYVWLDLGALVDVESIEIEFPDQAGAGDDTFATEYQLLASNQTAPTVPPDSSWTMVCDVYPTAESYEPCFQHGDTQAGDGGVDLFDLPTPLRARYIGFYLIENNKTDWFSTEDIRVSEIRINGRSIEELPPEPLTPTCANGRMP